MKVGIIGAGRIGKVHAKNISMFVPKMEIKTIADPFMNEQTEAFAKSCGIPNTTKDANDILNDPEIDAVLICSSTDTHSKYIIEAAHAGKNIFCEKPIDYDLEKVHAAINAAKEAGVKLQIVNKKFHLNNAKPLVYSHGEYLGTGKSLGTFGYSVKKKKKAGNRRKR